MNESPTTIKENKNDEITTPLTGNETGLEMEAAFDRWRRKIGLFAGPAAGVLVYLMPLPLDWPAHRLAALMTGIVLYWVTEAIPVSMTALLGPVLAVVFGIGGAADVFGSFGHPILFLFIGSFILARAMELHRLDRRFSLWFLSLPWIGKSPARILFMIGAITAFLSMWISNTAATVMLLPIGLGILGAMRSGTDEKGSAPSRQAAGMMLMIAFAASVGGIGTPIGTPPNLIGIGLIEKQIGRKILFLEWMALAIPLLIVMYLGLYTILSWLHSASHRRASNPAEFIKQERNKIGRWSRGEVNTLLAFLVAVFLWTLPGVLGLLLGDQNPLLKEYDSRLPEGAVAILTASLLFLLPTDWKRQEYTLSWKEAGEIDWGTILLFGGGLALGDMMLKTGLSQKIGEGLFSVLSVHSLWGITALSILLGMGMSELASNTASANMVVPVVIALAVASGVSPLPPALGATLGASYGFILPISTAPNAIVYSSGLVPIRQMMRTGILFDLVGFGVIWGGLRLLCPLLGLM